MKKLMIAAAIVCAAAFTQAASIKWSDKASTGSGGALYAPDGTTELTTWAAQSGYSISSVILMNTADYSQSELLTALRGGSYTWGADALGTADAGAKGVPQTTTEVDNALKGSSIDVYYAVLATSNDGTESVLISTLKSGINIPNDDSSVTVAWSKAGHTFSQNKFGDATYSAAGWYTVASVPEPTSGLLLLLGMAGLALRRRRA